MASAGGQALGLIAGHGSFPMDVARSARERGRTVVALAFLEHTDPAIEAAASDVTWLHPGQVARGVAALRSAGVRDAVMAGKLPKAALFAPPRELMLDTDASAILAGVAARGDRALLSAVADHLAGRGIRLLDQAALVPELLAGEGVLGSVEPGAATRADIAHGLRVARRLADLDVGQTVVVKDGAVLALEAIEGTDAAIRRGAGFARGACVVKVAGSRSDPRFDLPAIGPDTLAVCAAAGVAGLACEAGRTLLLERDATLRRADRHGVAVVGVAP